MVVLRNSDESESESESDRYRPIEYSEELSLSFPPSPTYFLPSPMYFPPSPTYFPLWSLPFNPSLPPSQPGPSSSCNHEMVLPDVLKQPSSSCNIEMYHPGELETYLLHGNYIFCHNNSFAPAPQCKDEDDRLYVAMIASFMFYDRKFRTVFLPSPLSFPPSPSASLPRPSSSLYVCCGHCVRVGHSYVDFNTVVLSEYKIQDDGGGGLDVISSGIFIRINGFVKKLGHIVDSRAKEMVSLIEQLQDWDRIVDIIADYSDRRTMYVEWTEEYRNHRDMTLNLVRQYLIQYEGGALRIIPGGTISRLNKSEVNMGQVWTSIPEAELIFQTKTKIHLSLHIESRKWCSYIDVGWNWLNTDAFETVDECLPLPLWTETSIVFIGELDMFDYPFGGYFRNENTTTRPPTEEQDNDITTIQVSQSTQEYYACPECGYHIWPPHPVPYIPRPPLLSDPVAREILSGQVEPVGIGSEGITPPRSSPATQQENLDEDLLSGQVEPVGIGSEGITPPQSSPAAQQENLDEDLLSGQVEPVGIGSEGITPPRSSPATRQENLDEDLLNFTLGNGSQLNSRPSKKRTMKERSPRGERDKYKTTGGRIKPALEEILKCKNMTIKDASRELKVSLSTLKRICRSYNISRWPPHGELHIGEASSTIHTQCVNIRAKYEGLTIKFQLSWPWRKTELEKEVKKRLQLEADTYFIQYKDDDDELILIACDDDLNDFISSSSLPSTRLIEVFFSPK